MTGTVTDKKKFRLREISENQRVDHEQELFYTELLWFELMEGEKRGLQFPIPKEHPEYDDSISEMLESLELGDNVIMSCKSMNKRNTKWICESIELV